MASIEVGISSIQLKQLEEALNPKQLKQAVYQAIKRTTTTGTVAVRKIVREKTYISAKYANRAVKTRMEGNEGVITISQKLVPLIGYKVSATKKMGVVAQVSKDRPPIILRHAFKGRVRAGEDGGHIGIFQRQKLSGPKATPRGIAQRLPIAEQFGPSVLQLIDVPQTFKELTVNLEDTLQKNIDSQISRFT